MLGFLLLLLTMAACQGGKPAPTATLTPFAPQTVPTPSSIEAYVERAHIQETQRVEYLDPLTQANRVVEDQALIQRVTSLLQSPDQPCDLSGSGPHESFLLVLSVPIRTDGKPVDHAVTVDYSPKTGTLSLSNIATGIWPISLQGRYSVPPSFGPALFGILGINPPTAQMVQIRAYRLDTEFPRGLSQQLPSYRVQKPEGEFEWARRVATALGFVGDPTSESKSAAQPMWTWTGPERNTLLDVYGNIAYTCSAPPAKLDADAPKTADQAVAATRAWLTARDLLPADCADDALAWPGTDGLGWEVRLRRRLDGVPVGSYWNLTGGLQVRLNSLGKVDSVGYLRHEIAEDALVPLKPVEQAWQELQSHGPTHFDFEGPPTGPTYQTFTITQVELGYRECCYGSTETQEELRPYYVFTGEAEIANWDRKIRASAYVPAWE